MQNETDTTQVRIPKTDAYSHYTSTSSLAGVDEAATVAWSCAYFSANFSKLLPPSKRANILDIGCGYGKNLKALAKMGYERSFGIDISEEQIFYAKNKLGLQNVELADALIWLAGRKQQFDVVLVLDVLEHLPLDCLLLLGEHIYAALKPGGTIIVQVPNGMSPLNPFTYGDLTHMRAFTPQSLQQLFLITGFTPGEYYEARGPVHGVLSGIKCIVWNLFFRVAIGLFVRAIHGKLFGGNLFSANIIAVATKAA